METLEVVLMSNTLSSAIAAESVARAAYDALALQKASNLSDLASASAARTNLGLGTLATQSGTFSGESGNSVFDHGRPVGQPECRWHPG